MAFAVKALEEGRWWDSSKRVAHEVSVGDVIEFSEVIDAQHFVNAGRAEWHKPDASPEPKDESKPAPKRGRKAKESDDVQEASE